jgi:hypothetical protein
MPRALSTGEEFFYGNFLSQSHHLMADRSPAVEQEGEERMKQETRRGRLRRLRQRIKRMKHQRKTLLEMYHKAKTNPYYRNTLLWYRRRWSIL